MRIVLGALAALIALGAYSAYADVPDRPTDVIADDISENEIRLSWSPPDDDGGSPITGYRIEYRYVFSARDPIAHDEEKDGIYAVKNVIESTKPNSTTHIHDEAKVGRDYTYRIYAINEDGESEYSIETRGKTSESSVPPDNIVPNPPDDLVAKAVSPTEIELTWKKPKENNSPPIEGYKIEQKKESDDYKTIENNTESGALKYTATDLETDTEYTFRISAWNAIGLSNASGDDTETPKDDSAREETATKPNRPNNVKVEVLSPSMLYITWDEPTSNDGPDASGYRIDYKTREGDYTTLTDDNGLVTSYTHSALSSSETYSYKIYAKNQHGESGASSTVSEKPAATQSPVRLTATGLSPTSVRLDWFPPSATFNQNIGGYKIEQVISTGVKLDAAKTRGSDTSFIISPLETDKEYMFVVSAEFTPHGSSTVSEPVTFTLTEDSGKNVERSPESPGSLQVTSSSYDQVALTWNAPSNNGGTPITGYRIDARSDGNYETIVADTGSTSRSYTHTGRDAETEYTYRVYAINKIGSGPPSSDVSVTTAAEPEAPVLAAPSPPRNLEASSSSPDRINLKWGAPADDGGARISEYRLEADSGDGFERISSGRSTSYAHMGLEQDTKYTYRVYATNSEGTSSPSVAASSTTEEEEEPEDPLLRVAGFPDPDRDARYYVDRYESEPEYKEWFDKNFPEYTIEEIVGTPEESPEKEAELAEESRLDYYTERYSESAYKRWFDSYFGEQALEELVPDEPSFGTCGEGTELLDGICQIIIE